jgi:hypothetical protein
VNGVVALSLVVLGAFAILLIAIVMVMIAEDVEKR